VRKQHKKLKVYFQKTGIGNLPFFESKAVFRRKRQAACERREVSFTGGFIDLFGMF